MPTPREKLESSLLRIQNGVDRKIAFLAWLNDELALRQASKAVLVGGSALEFYSGTRFQSADIDIVCASRKELSEIFSSVGFGKEGRYWYDDSLDILVEVPDDELAGETKRICAVRSGHGNSTAYVIGIEDLIIDRLEQYVFGKANESLEQAYWLVDSPFP